MLVVSYASLQAQQGCYVSSTGTLYTNKNSKAGVYSKNNKSVIG